MSKLLDVKSICMRFGGLKAVDDLSFSLNDNDLVGLIGPNGAGKTTVFNMITGVYQPTSGEIFFQGKSLKGLKPFEISRLGMTRTFQNIRLFKELSVLENILSATSKQIDYGFTAAILKNKSFLQKEQQLRDKAFELLSLFKLENRAEEAAGSLPYGDQRKLEIIRALATNPKLICLDEPAAGLNHQETHSLMETIARIRQDFKLTVLLIEHDMKLVMGICERIIVLDHGCRIEEGTPQVVQNSAKVIEAYLGTEVHL